ncbi:MAG TPA: O-antigen ligase family protein [Bacteroidia bacterium]|nr:O-antigen ligase family protein [Bacteroidia bacterium]
MELTLRKNYHRWLYYLGLLGIAAGLSVSKAFISMGTLLVAASWLLEGGFAAKWRLLMARKSVLVLIAVFAIHVVGLLWTSDFEAGLKDVRIKLPLLIIPLVIGTSAPLNRKQFEGLLILFSLGVIIASVRTYLIATGVIHKEITDLREASDLVPLIRLALFSALSILFFGRWFFRSSHWAVRVSCVVTSAWLLYFMFYMQSLTGLVVLIASTTLIAALMAAMNKRRKILTGILAAVVVTVAFCGYYVVKAYNEFYALRGNEVPKLYTVSSTGRKFHHRLDVPMYENGNKAMANVCWSDLMLEWNKRSSMPFHQAYDPKGNPIPFTLVRYLTSRGLLKDSAGMSQLSDAEIREIENGITNYRDKDRNPLEKRAYQVFWETYNYFAGGDPSGSSITMRIELMDAALHSIGERPWIGSGTGSQKNTYAEYYAATDTRLHEKFQWLHAHNQFLSIAVTLGIPAALFFVFSLWWPARSMRRWNSYLYLAFFLIVVLSFLDDDTLETQQGVTFFAFFNAILLYAMPFVSSVIHPPPPPEDIS